MLLFLVLMDGVLHAHVIVWLDDWQMTGFAARRDFLEKTSIEA
jgi:hypothetical protein